MLAQAEALHLIKADDLDAFHRELSKQSHEFCLDFDELFLQALEYSSLDCLRFLVMQDYELDKLDEILPKIISLNDIAILEDFADNARASLWQHYHNVDVHIINHALITNDFAMFNLAFSELRLYSSDDFEFLINSLSSNEIEISWFSGFERLSVDALVTMLCHLDKTNSLHYIDVDDWIGERPKNIIFSSNIVTSICNKVITPIESEIAIWFGSFFCIKNINIFKKLFLKLHTEKLIYVEEICDYSLQERLEFVRRMDGVFSKNYFIQEFDHILKKNPYSHTETLAFLTRAVEENEFYDTSRSDRCTLEQLVNIGSETIDRLVYYGVCTAELLTLEMHPYYDGFDSLHFDVLTAHNKYSQDKSVIYQTLLTCIDKAEDNYSYIIDTYNILNKTGICASREEFDSELAKYTNK